MSHDKYLKKKKEMEQRQLIPKHSSGKAHKLVFLSLIGNPAFVVSDFQLIYSKFRGETKDR